MKQNEELLTLYYVNKAYQETIALTLEKLRAQLNDNLQRQVKKLNYFKLKQIDLFFFYLSPKYNYY